MFSTAQTNRLRALLLAGDDADRRAARSALTDAALRELASRTPSAAASRDHAVRQAVIQRLPLALQQARCQLDANRRQLLAIVDDIAPGLTGRYGVGPVSAAQAVVSFSHPGRCRNEAAFAALGGTNPIPASSGRIIRHRLNRGGDRALNRAIHTIALTRIRSCPRTRAYVQTTAAGPPRSRPCVVQGGRPLTGLRGALPGGRGQLGRQSHGAVGLFEFLPAVGPTVSRPWLDPTTAAAMSHTVTDTFS